MLNIYYFYKIEYYSFICRFDTIKKIDKNEFKSEPCRHTLGLIRETDMKKKMLKTKTSLYLLSILILLLIMVSFYFTLYKQVSETVYQKEEQTIEIFANQIEGTLDLICNSVNTDLSKFVEDEKIQQFFVNKGASGQEYNYVRNEIMKTIAFNSYNSFVEMYLYTNDKCIYPQKNSDMKELLTVEEQRKVEEYNGNTVWLHKDVKKGQFVVAKKVLLSSSSFKSGGYIVAFINMNIMDFIQKDFASMEEAKIVLSNEFGEIAVKESENGIAGTEDAVVFNKELSVSGFEISFYIPKAVLLKSVSDMQQIMFKSILAAAFIFLVISYIMSIYIAHPFKDLIQIMKKSEGRLVINDKKYFNYEANQFNEYYNKLVRKNQKLIHDIYEKDIQMLQTQLEMLQNQINPHFLYNTLESVYLTLEAKGEKESAKIVYLLSKLFKYALKANKTIALSKEVEMMDRYLEIEKYRFGDRFDWNITVDSEVENIRVPKLLLQPLAENAVKHGIEPSDTGGTIQVSITSYENILMILVHDNGAGMTSDKVKKIREQLNDSSARNQTEGSIGLQNVNKRLANYYGTDAKMEIESVKGEYTEITIIIPNYKKMETKES